MKTHPTPSLTQLLWACATDPRSSFVGGLITYVFSQLPSLMDQGLSGYSLAAINVTNPFPSPGAPTQIAGVMASTVVQDRISLESARKLLEPLNNTILEQSNYTAQCYLTTTQYGSFLDWFDQNYDQSTAGNSSFIVSRLLDKKTLTQAPEKLRQAVKTALSASGGMSAFMVAGKGVQNAQPRGGSDAVSPGWRNAYVHACKWCSEAHNLQYSADFMLYSK
jgi:hypothetical protein